ncbi:MAG: hypothetical protein R3A12_09650 [Ignavibacteria bacterium]
MKKLFLYSFVILSFILSGSGKAYSANEYFRSITSGNWNSLSTWQMSTNNGSTWIPASIIPDSTSGIITIQSTHTVTVTVNASADQLSITGGTLSINSGIEFTYQNGNLTLSTGNTISGTGTFKTRGTCILDIKNGSTFSANFKVNTGKTSASDYGSPYIGRFFGNVTVDTGAELNVLNGGYDLEVYGTILNNGIISGSGTSKLIVRGLSLVNNNSMTVGHLAFDTSSTITGAGSYTNGTVFINASGNVSLGNNVTFSPSASFTINNGGILNPNNFTFTINSGTLLANSGSTLLNSGLLRTQGAVDLNVRNGSNFNTNVKINTGTTRGYDSGPPYTGKLYGNVTVDGGAELNVISSGYFLEVYGTVVNNGTISGPGSTFIMSGPSLVNNNSMTSTNFNMDSTTSISGAGSFTNNTISIVGTGNVSLQSNITVSPITYFAVNNAGGILNPNSFTFKINSGAFYANPGSTILNSGMIRTEGTVTLNIRNGSFFNAPLTVATGTTKLYDTGFPFVGKLYGNVTINAGAVLEVPPSGYFAKVYGNVLNNGTISGAGSTFIMSGPSLVNNNSISSAVFNMDSTTSISGAGTFTSNEIHIMGTGNVKLLSNITVSPVNYFAVNNAGGILNPNSFTFKINSGTFYANPGSIVSNSGKVRTEGTVTLNIRNTSSFKAPLEVSTGTTNIYDTGFPYFARMYGNVTIFNNATLAVVPGYQLEVYANLYNSGTITGTSPTPLNFAGSNQLFQGTGSVLTSINIYDSSVVTMGSNHKLQSININAGGTYNISNYKVSFTASNPITQNGTFITTNSKVEYNGTALQTVSTANIVYGGLIINDTAGANMSGNVTVNDTLSLMQGDLNLNGQIITLSSVGYLKETPGNLLYGSPGYITITKNTGTPSAMNVGGLGAVLTASTDLGSTEVRRGHTVQTGLDGGTSIKRYYDITPANNTDLHASLVYKYDESELNGKPEAGLKLFKSENLGSTWQFMGGTVNTVANEITILGLNSFSRWAADTSGMSEATAVIMEGFYDVPNNRLNMTDTVRFYLRNSSSPYALVDSAIVTIDSLTFNSPVQFANAGTGQYYLQVKHRNSLETWSKDRIKYIAGSMFNYDFTFSADQAYGNNEILKGTKYCIYSGDVNQNGFIDLADVLDIYNNSTSFINGYVVTDVNGDRITDLADILIAYNNAIAFVSAKFPA